MQVWVAAAAVVLFPALAGAQVEHFRNDQNGAVIGPTVRWDENGTPSFGGEFGFAFRGLFALSGTMIPDSETNVFSVVGEIHPLCRLTKLPNGPFVLGGVAFTKSHPSQALVLGAGLSGAIDLIGPLRILGTSSFGGVQQGSKQDFESRVEVEGGLQLSWGRLAFAALSGVETVGPQHVVTASVRLAIRQRDSPP
jgi:hypothetical protein